MSVAKSLGVLAVAAGLVLGAVGLYWSHEALRIHRSAYVAAEDAAQYSIGPYASRGMACLGVGVVILVAGIVGIAQARQRVLGEVA